MLFFSQSFKLMVCWGKACYHRLLGEKHARDFQPAFFTARNLMLCQISIGTVLWHHFLWGEKMEQKFWMQSNEKDRQVMLLEEMVCVNSCLACCSSCWKQILNLVRLPRGWSQPVRLRESWNHLSHGAVCPKPDLFTLKKKPTNQKKPKG